MALPMITYAARKAALENITITLTKEPGLRGITMDAARRGTDATSMQCWLVLGEFFRQDAIVELALTIRFF